jgi:hypothetical protein
MHEIHFSGGFAAERTGDAWTQSYIAQFVIRAMADSFRARQFPLRCLRLRETVAEFLRRSAIDKLF